MRLIRFHIQWVVASPVLAGAALGMTAFAAEPPPPPKYQTVVPGVTLHQLSPVEYFRVLLGMNPAEREHVLTNQAPGMKRVLLAKLKEYDALPREVREARLRQTELRWNLMDLMKLPPSHRADRLKQVAPKDLALVEERLRRWDAVPANLQKAYLENEQVISLYLRLQANAATATQEIANSLPPDARKNWARELARWQSLPPDQRQELCDRFRHFFELNGEEQQKTISALSEGERQEMEKSLQTYAAMPPDQRKVCMDSFRKFATMAPEEREQFLKNAARWQSMTPRERELWRAMVQRLPPVPPLPPRAGGSAPGLSVVMARATLAPSTNALNSVK